MQTNKKTISDDAFNMVNTINSASITANLYGKLFALQLSLIHIPSPRDRQKYRMPSSA